MPESLQTTTIVPPSTLYANNSVFCVVLDDHGGPLYIDGPPLYCTSFVHGGHLCITKVRNYTTNTINSNQTQQIVSYEQNAMSSEIKTSVAILLADGGVPHTTAQCIPLTRCHTHP